LKRLHFWKTLFFVLVSAVLMVGCSSKQSGETEEKDNGGNNPSNKNQELVIAVNENFISMDPHNTGDTNSNSVQSAMLEGLLGTDEEGKIIPQLAEEYSVSDNALEYSFKLRQGVKFHDGEAFNAEAVKASFERIMKDESLRLNSRGFNIITG
jgi:glutathione transport system substrate-binding protein